MNHRELVSKNYVCVYAYTYVYITRTSLLCVHSIYVCICLVNACVFICMYSYICTYVKEKSESGL